MTGSTRPSPRFFSRPLILAVIVGALLGCAALAAQPTSGESAAGPAAAEPASAEFPTQELPAAGPTSAGPAAHSTSGESPVAEPASVQPLLAQPPPREPFAAGPLLADRLLEFYALRLDSEPAADDEAMLSLELARLQLRLSPAVRLHQSSDWSFGGTATLGVGAWATIPLDDAEGGAQRELAEHRLLLAKHNARADKLYRLHELRRTLRLLAHLQEVEEVLAEHRNRLRERRPEWSDLSDRMPGRAGVSQQQMAFLELLQALDRTRREREMLIQVIASQLNVPGERLQGAKLGRPTVPAPSHSARKQACGGSTDETRRAWLLLEEARLAKAVPAAREQAQISLELGGDLRYRQTVTPSPWQADLSLSLRVTLPTASRLDASLSADLTPNGLSQRLSVNWPGSIGIAEARNGGKASEAYRQSLDRARLAMVRATTSEKDAAAAVRIRRLALANIEAAALSGTQPESGLLGSRTQARVALLNAELELDLARFDLARACGVGV